MKSLIPPTAIVSLTLLALTACGSGNFSDDFAQEIQTDCYQTVACAPASGPVDTCVTRTGDALNNAAVTKQQYFVDTVSRCGLMQSCGYVSCTQTAASPTGYAATHVNEISYDCQQKAACRIAGGIALDQAWVNQCVSEQGALFNADPVQQSAFDGRFQRCTGKTGCDWTMCP